MTSTAMRAALGTSSCRSPSRFGADLAGEKIDAGRVATRPGEARDKAKLDRVVGDAEDDRDRRGRRLGGERTGVQPGVAITAT